MLRLTKKFILTGTLMAVTMATVFWVLSSGWSLRLTFVPGVCVAYALFLLRITRKAPAPQQLLPLYLLALAVQMLHFSEEYITGFYNEFPKLFGAGAYAADAFVIFNMCAYFLFVLGALIIFYEVRELMMIPLFFIVYGVMGNAISHFIFSIITGGYFPGLYTSLIYWILAPMLFRTLWRATQ